MPRASFVSRIAMLPEFISVQLADKILSVGKSINFLREICCDEKPFSERDKIKEVFLDTDGKNTDSNYAFLRVNLTNFSFI